MHSLFFHVHVLFAGAVIVGAVLFTFWAKNNVKGEHLEHLSFYLLGIGILGLLITSAFAGNNIMNHKSWEKDMNKENMMQMMKNHEDNKEKMPMGMMKREEMMKHQNTNSIMPGASFQKEEPTTNTNTNAQ